MSSIITLSSADHCLLLCQCRNNHWFIWWLFLIITQTWHLYCAVMDRCKCCVFKVKHTRTKTSTVYHKYKDKSDKHYIYTSMVWLQQHVTTLLTIDMRQRVLYKHDLCTGAHCAWMWFSCMWSCDSWSWTCGAQSLMGVVVLLETLVGLCPFLKLNVTFAEWANDSWLAS